MSSNVVDLGDETSGAFGDAAGVDPELFMNTDEPELEFDVDGTELSSTKEAELDAELDEGFPENDIHVPQLDWNIELAKEAEGGAFRSGAITPDGIIEEDFEKVLGTPQEEEAQSEFSDVEKYGIIEVAGDDLWGRKVIVFSSCKLPSNKTFDHQRLLQYKKNLKALYLVHPTNFIKILWNIFKPFISAKFGRKMMYVDYLMELKNHLHFDQLSVPPPVLE
ncbi:uncharacterized protein LOC124255898 [Haliotis rubra]|uniref:uncharacterized protein LOC124255898 n=1 Tax=Haliotis rubra TaxID=36100 RepID=UPI001EE62877|nr:uncharacterized protein LOC124255898 [Haliotis rubra]